MIFFLYGKDSFRRGRRKKAIFAEIVKKYPKINYSFFSGENEDSIIKTKEFLAAQGLFFEKRIGVLDEAEKLDGKKLVKELLPIAENKDIALIVAYDGKPTKDFTPFLKAPVRPEEFRELTPAEFPKFISTTSKELGLKIEPAAITKLAKSYGTNLWGIYTELQKLSAGSGNVKAKDVEALGFENVSEYWPTLNALQSPALSTRLWALEMLFLQGESTVKTFSILAGSRGSDPKLFAKHDILIKSGKLDFDVAMIDLVL